VAFKRGWSRQAHARSLKGRKQTKRIFLTSLVAREAAEVY
jgi:hypothetical protein